MSGTLRSPISALMLATLVLAPLTPVAAQDGDIDGTVSRAVVQPLPSQGSYELNAALTRLAANPRDVNALIDAGNAAMALGDSEAAMGFLGRADQLSPANPRVKATLASAMVRNENPFDAIPLFDAAERAGATDAMLAGDRGLAYDLVGDNVSAQRFYRQALAAAPLGEARDDILRRLALSQAIEGDRKAFEATLLPQLKAPGAAAWRTRAFGLAILGDEAEAVKIVYGTMPRDRADAMAPYLRYMIKLTPAQQAAAANFGHFPRAAQIGRDDPRVAMYASAVPRRVRTADAALVPDGKALGKTAAKDTKASRKRKRDTQVAAAAPRTPTPTARATATPTPTPVATAAPTPRATAPKVRIAAATQPPPAFQRPTIFTPATAAASTPPAASTPVAQPSIGLAAASAPTTTAIATPSGTSRPASSVVAQPSIDLTPTPSPTPAPSAEPTRLAAVSPLPASAASAIPPRVQPGSGPVSTPTPAPTASGSFDLATVARAPVTTSAPATGSSAPAAAIAPAAAPTPVRLRLADAFSDFRPPEDEARSAVAAVDIGKIVPTRPKAKVAVEDERGPLPGAPAGTRRSAAVETPASEKTLKAAGKSAGSEKPKAATPSHPSRIWIQLAAGRDKAALAFDWRKMSRASADLFKAKKVWTTPWGQTNRLLVGPFESQAAANAFLKDLKKKDTDAFVWTSPAGQAVDPLPAK